MRFQDIFYEKEFGLENIQTSYMIFKPPYEAKILFLITSVIPRILIRCMHPKVLTDIRSPNTCVSNFRSKIGMNQCLIKRKSDF